MELEDSQFEDSLELVAKFEDKCLKPLRTAKCKDLDMKKMMDIVEWAKLIDKLSAYKVSYILAAFNCTIAFNS